MQFLKNYASQNGFSYKDLINDFYSSTPEEQNSFLMQVGGENQVEGPEDQMMQIVLMFAEITGSNPKELMQQMSQLPPEEHEKVMQGMIQTIQQSQQQAEQGQPEQGQQQPEQEQQQMRNGGIPITSEGYRELNPIDDPYAMIPSGRISMQGIEGDINAYDGRTGQFLERMQPGGEYQFDTDMVLEEPLYAQTGSTPVVTKIDKNFIHLSNGKKITQNQFKTDYLDRMAFLNTRSYNTEERRNAASIVSSYNTVNKETTLAANRVKKPVNPLTGELDPAKGYWDRALNYTEDRKDPRATSAEAKIMPFSGVEAEGFLDYAGTVAGHLQKKGNQVLTGYYEYPSTTLERYHGEMGGGEKFVLDLATDPAFLYDFTPMAVKAAGTQIAKYAPVVAKVAKETAELVGKYGSIAAHYIARHGKVAAKYIAEHGLEGIEKALGAIEKYGPQLDKFTSLKTQLLKQVNNDNNEDPYITYLTSISEKTEEDSSIAETLNKTQKNLGTIVKASSSKSPANLTKAFETINPIAAGKSKEIGNPEINYSEIFTKSADSVPQKGTTPNYLASSPKFSMGDYGKNSKTITVKGANQNYSLTPTGKNTYVDGSGKNWVNDAQGFHVVGSPKTQPNSGRLKTQGVPQRLKEAASAKTPSNSSIGKKALLENVNFQPSEFTDAEIDAMAAANMPGAVAPVNHTLDTVGGEKYWKYSPADLAAAELAAPIKKKNPQYKFQANNFIQNILTGNNLASAFQSPAAVFRQRANVQAEELPEIDINPAMQQLTDQFRVAQRNINMNSTTGASVAANFYGETLDKMVELSNNVTVQNQQIKAKNRFSKINAANTQYQQQQQYDAAAYDDFLRTSANADMIKQQALSEAGSVYLKQKKDKQMLDMLPMLNPSITETSATAGKMFGNRTFEQNPEYIRLALQVEAEAKATLAAEKLAAKQAAAVKTPK